MDFPGILITALRISNWQNKLIELKRSTEFNTFSQISIIFGIIFITFWPKKAKFRDCAWVVFSKSQNNNFNGLLLKLICAQVLHWVDLNFKLNVFKIRMSQWHLMLVDGAEFWISCMQAAFLSSFSCLQLIQNSAQSIIRIDIVGRWQKVPKSDFQRQFLQTSCSF